MSVNDRLMLAASRSTTRVAQLILSLVAATIFVLVISSVVTRTLVTSTGHALLEIRHQERSTVVQLKSPRQWSASTRTLAAVLVALGALVLWCFALRWVDVMGMNELGFVSVLPVASSIALGCLTLGFCLTLLGFERVRSPVLLLYLLILIFMLYATPALVEQAPRFQVTYWLAGHTDYVLRNGGVDPFLDAYFNWPGFFVLTGLLARISGVHSVLAFAQWASFAYNLLYLAPMYLIFTTATSDRRTVWLGLWFFYITDWVWQDYFDPQGLNFFLYLVVIAIVLKEFRTTRVTSRNTDGSIALRWRSLFLQLASPRTVLARPSPRIVLARLSIWRGSAWARITSIRPSQIWSTLGDFPAHLRRFRAWSALSDIPDTPEQRRKRLALLGMLLAVFGLSVFSHPITPFFALLSVTALTLSGRVMPRWLPILMGAMILGWDFTAATPYMAGHLHSDLAAFGNLQVVASSNVTDRLVAGNPEHQFVSHVRALLTAAIWGLACVGALVRWRPGSMRAGAGATCGNGSLFSRDLPFLLLVVAPGILVVAQPYGGEMVMRYYLFTLPIVSFFAAAAFRADVNVRHGITGKLIHWLASRSVPVTAIALVAVCLLLLGGFMFARYGNESADYVTYDEADAVAYLYNVAPPHSLLLEGWTGTPWRYQDLEMYTYAPLYPGQDFPGQEMAAAIQAHDIKGILDKASNRQYPAVYVIFSRSQKAQAQMFAGLPPTAFDGVEEALLQSGRFKLIYQNSDADIMVYVPQHGVRAMLSHSLGGPHTTRGML